MTSSPPAKRARSNASLPSQPTLHSTISPSEIRTLSQATCHSLLEQLLVLSPEHTALVAEHVAREPGPLAEQFALIDELEVEVKKTTNEPDPGTEKAIWDLSSRVRKLSNSITYATKTMIKPDKDDRQAGFRALCRMAITLRVEDRGIIGKFEKEGMYHNDLSQPMENFIRIMLLYGERDGLNQVEEELKKVVEVYKGMGVGDFASLLKWLQELIRPTPYVYDYSKKRRPNLWDKPEGEY